ncbi:hypothetical protein ACFFJT_13530 [Dyella flava]|uniref:Uncharacterized protein n=1 Tax=Dyella flava TaxID=1920170 RepID=A0ABS2JZ98_9GAMM|nr:hypothetical protein [Dyella flava]MBM7124316.1 hypothetical protein [Dyella flava]GLQ52398.1 hypothetical protein GCM10010872_38470 [Dyella flava]
MTFETMMMRSLFGACVLVCGLILAAMVTAKAVPVQLAAQGTASAPLVSAAAGSVNTAG